MRQNFEHLKMETEKKWNRPLTFINDMNAFIAAICDKRDHSDENLTIALGLDGGQGKLISTLTVSPEGEGNKAERKKTNNSLKSTGTRRAFVAAKSRRSSRDIFKPNPAPQPSQSSSFG